MTYLMIFGGLVGLGIVTWLLIDIYSEKRK